MVLRHPRAGVAVLDCLEAADHVDASIRVGRIAGNAVIQFRVESAIPAVLFCNVEGAPGYSLGARGLASYSPCIRP
jgi:hypothetical protein